MTDKATVATLDLRLDKVEEFVERHDKILVRGNGVPSLQEDVRAIKKYVDEERASRTFYTRLVLGAVITNVMALGFAALVWFVKIYPVIERLSREVAGR